MKQSADGPSVPAQFTPSLRVERFDEVVQYDDALTAKPPQRTYEKVWQGRCGPDFTVEDSEDSVRFPVDAGSGRRCKARPDRFCRRAGRESKTRVIPGW